MKELVYAYIAQIPEGKVVTYAQIACALGNKHLARAVGNALHKNPDPGKYPCHRVVNSNGALAAHFAFGGIEGQKRLLQSEGVEVISDHVDLKRYGYKKTSE